MSRFSVEGNLVDVVNRRMFPGSILVSEGRIEDVRPAPAKAGAPYVLPGFIDAHVHIESSMLPPSEFARLAAVHGTVATVSDPHEIANVLGVPGVDFMLQDAARVPLKMNFGCPSCVPATEFETAGGRIDSTEVEELLRRDDILYLSEMMNFPGVLNADPEVMRKIEIARNLGKPIDGHAPGLIGDAARRYAAAGITTDHECVTEEEARDKLGCGVKIIIREGSAAKNFDALAPLIGRFSDRLMFCSDDKHPDELIAGHINVLARRAVALGFDPMDVLQIACVNPVLHYGLSTGLLQRGDRADFILVDNLHDFNVIETYCGGRKIAAAGHTLLERHSVDAPNRFRGGLIEPARLRCKAAGETIRVIEVLDGQLITNELRCAALVANGYAEADPARDILKLAVHNRYHEAPPAISFVKNFGLKSGALASSVAHDSHNVIAAGTNDRDLAAAMNLVVEARGGIAFCDGEKSRVLPLPIAGLMSTEDGYNVARDYDAIDRMVKLAGSGLRAPCMTLSFLALLVIPRLKLSDKGLFDGGDFKFVPAFV